MPNQWIQCFVETCMNWDDGGQCGLDTIQVGSRHAWWNDVKYALANEVPEERDTSCQNFSPRPEPRNSNGIHNPNDQGTP